MSTASRVLWTLCLLEAAGCSAATDLEQSCRAAARAMAAQPKVLDESKIPLEPWRTIGDDRSEAFRVWRRATLDTARNWDFRRLVEQRLPTLPADERLAAIRSFAAERGLAFDCPALKELIPGFDEDLEMVCQEAKDDLEHSRSRSEMMLREFQPASKEFRALLEQLLARAPVDRIELLCRHPLYRSCPALELAWERPPPEMTECIPTTSALPLQEDSRICGFPVEYEPLVPDARLCQGEMARLLSVPPPMQRTAVSLRVLQISPGGAEEAIRRTYQNSAAHLRAHGWPEDLIAKWVGKPELERLPGKEIEAYRSGGVSYWIVGPRVTLQVHVYPPELETLSPACLEAVVRSAARLWGEAPPVPERADAH